MFENSVKNSIESQNETTQNLNFQEPQVLSVEQLNIQIKQLLEGHVGNVWVRGEISNFKAHTSGHFYFSLKDNKSQISAVMFRGYNTKLKFKPTDGMEVVLKGRISVYEPRGSYQIICDMMEPVGAGALQKAFEQLKEKLKSEGLFDTAKKREIPPYPKKIAVVTSPTGAAIRDILNVLSRRASNVQVIVVPTLVQGETAAPQIVIALNKAYKIKDLDVIIVGRGGGSMEDMWCFNDEMVARTIATSPIPIISAIGHEIDFTISDFVADLRAPTPSAAAELVAKSSQEVSQKLINLDRMLSLSLNKLFGSLQQQLVLFSKRLVDPKRKLQDLRIKNDDQLNQLSFAMNRFLEQYFYELTILAQKLKSPLVYIQENKKLILYLNHQMKQNQQHILESKENNLSRLMQLLDSISPLKVVERGYAIVKKENKIIKDATLIKSGDELNVQVHKGSFEVIVK